MHSVTICNNYGEITLKVQCHQRSWHITKHTLQYVC